jgi:DNA-binding MarR family transcriptional regulator
MTTSAPPTELTEAELAAWRGFLRVHAALSRELDAELQAQHELPLSSYDVLVTLRSADGRRLRMADLADRALLSRSGMTRLVDRLAKQGLLRREDCPDDARGCFAVLTEAGEAVLEPARRTHLDGVRDRFLSKMEDGDLERLGALWERVAPGAPLGH